MHQSGLGPQTRVLVGLSQQEAEQRREERRGVSARVPPGVSSASRAVTARPSARTAGPSQRPSLWGLGSHGLQGHAFP